MADVTIAGLPREIATNTSAIIPITIAGITYGIPVSAIITASGNMGTGSIQLPAGNSNNRPNNPQAGSIRWNTSLSAIETFNGVNWSGDKLNVDVLVVGGGGGGGVNGGGGGGGGAVIVANTFLNLGFNYSVTVGSGGTGGNNTAYNGGTGGNGGNSIFNNIIATGGGGGGNYTGAQGATGANGGGGGDAHAGGSGLGGLGSAPSLPASVTGTIYAGYNGSAQLGGTHRGGGGGGAGGSAISTMNGANGVSINFEGISYYYGGGGGGGGWNYAGGPGGLGGGGGGASNGYGGGTGGGLAKNSGLNGTSLANVPNNGRGGSNTGGGGGGGTFYSPNGSLGAPGGSGIVQVRYLGSQKAVGGDRIFQATIGNETYTVHEYTAIGAAFFAT